MLAEAESCTVQHNQAVETMPGLITRSINVSNQLSGLEIQRNRLEQKLEALAESNVKARHEVPLWKKIVKSVCSVVSAIPVYRAVFQLIGGAGNLIVDCIDNPNWQQTAFDGAVDLASKTKSFEDSANAFSEEWAGFTNAWNLKTDPPCEPPNVAHV